MDTPRNNSSDTDSVGAAVRHLLLAFLAVFVINVVGKALTHASLHAMDASGRVDFTRLLDSH